MKQVTIRQALQQVADYPGMVDDNLLTKPTHELMARALFEIANSPSPSVRGSMTRANKARKMILDRMAGKRRAGTKPLSGQASQLEFLDLTGGELGAGEAEGQAE
jgi:hypothetical protein